MCRPFAVAGSGGGRRGGAGSGDASMVHTLSVLANLVAVVAAGVLRSLLHCGLAAASPFRAVAFVVCVDRSVFKTFGTKLGQPKQAHRTHTVFKEALSLPYMYSYLCRCGQSGCSEPATGGTFWPAPLAPLPPLVPPPRGPPTLPTSRCAGKTRPTPWSRLASGSRRATRCHCPRALGAACRTESAPSHLLLSRRPCQRRRGGSIAVDSRLRRRLRRRPHLTGFHLAASRPGPSAATTEPPAAPQCARRGKGSGCRREAAGEARCTPRRRDWRIVC